MPSKGASLQGAPGQEEEGNADEDTDLIMRKVPQPCRAMTAQANSVPLQLCLTPSKWQWPPAYKFGAHNIPSLTLSKTRCSLKEVLPSALALDKSAVGRDWGPPTPRDVSPGTHRTQCGPVLVYRGSVFWQLLRVCLLPLLRLPTGPASRQASLVCRVSSAFCHRLLLAHVCRGFSPRRSSSLRNRENNVFRVLLGGQAPREGLIPAAVSDRLWPLLQRK